MRPAIAATLALILTLGLVSLVGAGSKDRPDIKVALVSDGRCGTPADSLATVMTKAGARPGDVVGDVTVCVTSRGDSALSQLSLRADELVDVETACTGTEATLDKTCTVRGRGELSASLIDKVGIGDCPSVGDARLVTRSRLSDLASRSVLLALMRRNQLLCVRVRLEYTPDDSAAAIVSQSDRTTWRYAFTLEALDN